MSATTVRAPVARSSAASLPGVGLPPAKPTGVMPEQPRLEKAQQPGDLIEFLFDVRNALIKQILRDFALGGGGENFFGGRDCGFSRRGAHVGQSL
jgi:hypothetical protein